MERASLAAEPPLVWLAPDVEPVAFTVRERLEDFVVEELPLVTPTGTGTHLWFELEKRGLSTRAALRRIAQALGRREREFGYAGQKDARAVTRQWASLEHVDPDHLRALELRDVRIGRIERSERKLQVGALAGNRFTLRLGGIDAPGAERVERVLDRVAELGLPNRYGPQRFGALGRGHLAGADLLAGRFRAFARRFADPAGEHDAEPDAGPGGEHAGVHAGEPDAGRVRERDAAPLAEHELEHDASPAAERVGEPEHDGGSYARDGGSPGAERSALPSARARLAGAIAGVERDPAALRALAVRLDAERAGLARHLARLVERRGGIAALGEPDWRDVACAVPQRSRRMAVSALQARVFNRVLAERLARAGPASLARLEAGDVAFVHASGASFVVGKEDLAPDARGPETAARLTRLELSPSGPVPGFRLLRAEGAPGEREAAALAAEGLSLTDFRGLGMGLDQRGARRPLRVPVTIPAGTPAVRRTADGALVLAFELPPGAFATALLAELRKEAGEPDAEL